MNEKTKRTPGGVRIILIVLGCLTFCLGLAGSFLPVLPTAPFLLVSAFCFARSSDRLYSRFCSSKLYKTHLETMRMGEGMTAEAKRHILLSVSAVMGISFVMMARAYLIKGSKGALIGCVSITIAWILHFIVFCFMIKTCPKEREEMIIKEGSEYDA